MKRITDIVSKPDLIHLINQTDDRMSFVDRNYVYRIVNHAYLKAFNKSIDEIIGHPVWEVVGTEAFETIIKPKLDRAFGGEEIRYEAWFDFPDSGRSYVVVRYRPSFESDGTVMGVSVTATDITELKQLEEEKLLYEKKVFQQSRMEQLGEMIAFIAHQWRGSLHTVSTYLMRLRMEMKECSNTVSNELFDRCEALFEQLSEHIEEVHSLYRQNDSSKEIKLHTAVTQAVSILQPRLRAENIHVDITIPENYIVSSNNSHLVHIFVVLFENSIDALKRSDQKNKKIQIDASCESGTITIDFYDNGDGVSAEIAQQLFSPGISTKGLSEHGYGLYFARQIVVSQLGGTISLVPNADGAWFQIILPICTCTVNV
ncbi:ATP-binding protein [Sulfuricurvum sp.]|uniref:ATP-binding protein n=1 Tax=Sulfuricurvum sp. TaxID=2025608 RepID=UPI002D450E68|nr:ATP-binding protein [Sulfuricurvum sp.]HZF71755.1 ATP-binding protein [Sulfuricurvum sp.]